MDSLHGAPSDAPCTRRRALWIVGAMCLGYFFAYFQRVAVPGTIFDRLQSDLAMSASQVALLSAIYLYVYAGMQPFVGIMTDRFGAGRVYVAGGVLMSLGAILFPLAQTPALLYAARALVGVGCSLIYLSVVKAISILFDPREFPAILGGVLLLGGSGGMAGTLPFERAAHAFDWRPALLGVGLLTALTIVATSFLLPPRRIVPSDQRRPLRAVRTVLTRRHSVITIVCASVSFAVYFVMQATMGKKLLTDCFGFTSPGAAAVTFTMVPLWMGTTVAGGIAARFAGNRRKPFLLASLGMESLALLLVLTALRGTGGGALLVAGVLLLAAGGVGTALFTATMREVNPPEATGTAVGLGNGTIYLTVAILTSVCGKVLDAFSAEAVATAAAIVYPSSAYQRVAWICFAAATAAFALAWLIPETRGRCLLDAPATRQSADRAAL